MSSDSERAKCCSYSSVYINTYLCLNVYKIYVSKYSFNMETLPCKETSFSPPHCLMCKWVPKLQLKGVFLFSRSAPVRAGGRSSYTMGWAPQWDDAVNVSWSHWEEIKASRMQRKVMLVWKHWRMLLKTKNSSCSPVGWYEISNEHIQYETAKRV